MRTVAVSLLFIVCTAACSETPLEDQTDAEVAETEKQIEAEAQSLTEAADEAVKILEAELDTELAEEGVNAPAAAAPTNNGASDD